MEPLSLNVLSEFKKNRLKSLVRFLFTKNLLEIVLLISSLLAMALLLGWLTLVQEFSAASASALSIGREHFGHNQEIKRINSVIQSVTQSGKDFAPLSPYVSELLGHLPADVRLTSLTIDRRQRLLKLSGVAKNRSALIAFKDALPALTWIERIESPASQLLQKENTPFEISAQLKLPALNVAPERTKTPARSSAAPIDE